MFRPCASFAGNQLPSLLHPHHRFPMRQHLILRQAPSQSIRRPSHPARAKPPAHSPPSPHPPLSTRTRRHRLNLRPALLRTPHYRRLPILRRTALPQPHLPVLRLRHRRCSALVIGRRTIRCASMPGSASSICSCGCSSPSHTSVRILPLRTPMPPHPPALRVSASSSASCSTCQPLFAVNNAHRQ